MASQWFYTQAGKKQGPVSTPELKQMAASGKLSTTDMIWKEGMAKEVPASQLQGLFTTLQKAPTVKQKQLPWDEDERSARNYTLLLSQSFLVATIVITIFVPLLIPFSFWIFVLTYLFVIKNRLNGRWFSADSGGWVEFSSGNIVRRADGFKGEFRLLSNRKFIDFIKLGKVCESWKIVNISGSQLDILDESGNIRGFKREAKSSSLAKIFETDRSDLIRAKWEPVNNEGPTIQFTEDGAMIRSDGFAARYKFEGTQPNEFISIQLGTNENIKLSVLSLSRAEMVLVFGESGAIHYRRVESISSALEKQQNEATINTMKTVGKGVLAAGAIGIAVLGVAAIAAAAASSGCQHCGANFNRRNFVYCPNCSRYL